MYTRQQYLANECSYDQYYSQFVTEAILQTVERKFTLSRLQSAYLEGVLFNSIPLKEWDGLSSVILLFNRSVGTKLKEAGDFFSVATGVCILKAAAKILVERSNNKDDEEV